MPTNNQKIDDEQNIGTASSVANDREVEDIDDDEVGVRAPDLARGEQDAAKGDDELDDEDIDADDDLDEDEDEDQAAT